jgi:naphthoate synthase
VTVPEWRAVGSYDDIRFEVADGLAKLTSDRPEVHNAFRPQTLVELSDALTRAREDESVGVIILTGAGDQAFCSGGDQRVRGDSGYLLDGASVGRFHVTDLHVQMRRCPKPVVAMVAGWAIGGGHVPAPGLRPDHRRRQRQVRTGGTEGRLLRRWVRSQRALRPRRAQEGKGDLVPLSSVRRRRGPRHGAGQHGGATGRARGSDRVLVPGAAGTLAVRPAVDEGSFHASEDGYAGMQRLAHDTNLLFYGTEEAQEGREAFKARRAPDFSTFPRRP